MKKTFLSFVALVAGAMGAFAQTDLVATLSHGSSITEYYGATALGEAYTAAVDGDIITLSSGEFTAVNIEKAITLRGAGMLPLESNGNKATYLLGKFDLVIPAVSSSTPTMENLYCTSMIYVYSNDSELKQAKINKCYLKEGMNCWRCNLFLVNCIVKNGVSARFNRSGSSDPANLHNITVNCIGSAFYGGVYKVAAAGRSSNYVAKYNMDHCVAQIEASGLNASVFTNSVLIGTASILSEETSISNCLCLNYTTVGDFQNISTANNVVLDADVSEIFKTLTTSNLSINEDFQLKDEVAATYLGDDETQVGIYGGTSPFNPTPLYPQIKKFAVKSSTEEGMLKVKIDVQ